MLAAQRLYGPHATDQWDNDSMACGRALYRLLPEDIHDRQPLIGGGGRFVLVADVRLDTRDELLALLGRAGEPLCDAAILLAAYERWGEGALEHVIGDFAFAMFDLDHRRVLLARDPLGQRPLHYHLSPKLFAFASMPKGLHALPEIPRGPDTERVAEFVVLMPESGNRTYFKDVSRVEAGQIVVVDSDGISSRRYWEPSPPSRHNLKPDAFDEELRDHMDRAVKARLRGAGNLVGTHLSAGLDSSIVTATTADWMAAANGRVAAFTSVPRAGFVRPQDAGRQIWDEGPKAAQLAATRANIEHILIHGNGSSPLDYLDRYFYLFEQPVRDLPNGVWYCAINDAARQRGIHTFLPAYMGNLTFSYSGMELFSEDFRKGRWLHWLREGSAAVRSGQMRWRGVLGAGIGPHVPPVLWHWLRRTFQKRDLSLAAYTGIHPGQMERLADLARHRDLDFSYRPRKDGFSTRLWALRRTDVGNVNKGALGGWGIDQRDPTTDRRLVEFCLSVPTEQFLRNGVTRSLARRAFVDRVPPEILQERKRGYQGADWYEGVQKSRAQIFDEVRHLEDSGHVGEILDLPRLRRLVENWPQDNWHNQAVEASYRLLLVRALAVGHFVRKAYGSNR
jgi:asparagine synthase (glutamine-hydrolysing)